MPPTPSEQFAPYGRQLITSRDVATRYRIHLNSVPRWVANQVIPPPDQTIRGRHYWYVDTLDEADRQRTKSAAKRRSAPARMPVANECDDDPKPLSAA